MATKVLICNERFLPRFGVDRILLLLAHRLASDSSYEVSFACLRCDERAVLNISPRLKVFEIPHGSSIDGADRFVADALVEAWSRGGAPGVLVTGGWPFFGVAAKSSRFGVRSIFIDAGAVPHDGLPDNAIPSQQELRRLRRNTLPSIGSVVAISDFIRRSQSIADRGSGDVEVALLGADHLAGEAFDPATAPDHETSLLDLLREKVSTGAKLVISLGRYEPHGYKSSPEIFDLARRVAAAGVDACILLLVGADSIDIPEDVAARFVCARTISDAALQEAMRLCDAGVSLTRWEGFNLPLTEMHYLGKPALAYAIGAHPEVIAHPWLLCAEPSELAGKLVRVLKGEAPFLADAALYAVYRERLAWERTLDAWTGMIARPVNGAPRGPRRTVLIDVTNSGRDPANSGVIRVTRCLTAELAHNDALDVIFVKWLDEANRYTRLDARNFEFLGSNAGPLDVLAVMNFLPSDGTDLDQILSGADPSFAAKSILLAPEVILDRSTARRAAWARERGLDVAFVLYDMLPVYQADLIDSDVTAAFPSYVEALADADAIWAISSYSLGEFERYARTNGLPLPAKRSVVWLPGQFSDFERNLDIPSATADRVEILCVSTIEPRKNHRVLVEAFRALRKRRPELDIRLTLVGNAYAGASDLAAWLRSVAEEDDYLAWIGILSDENLGTEYKRCQFTVYPSLVEGFGLPILESLWMGAPCLCNNTGVMQELATDGGCLTVDMTNADALSWAMERLATDEALREDLAREARTRSIDDWANYSERITRCLLEVSVTQ